MWSSCIGRRPITQRPIGAAAGAVVETICIGGGARAAYRAAGSCDASHLHVRVHG
jgi:hypothetical protein